jgi:hypothetical protein
MSITRSQWLAIAILFFTVLTGGSAQLVDLVGAGMTKSIIALSTLTTGFLAGLQIILGGQGQQIKDVSAMPGVDKITVNASASPALATLAVDPAQAKIAAAPRDLQAVAETAAGANGGKP